MTEIPEHLLKRSRERRSALTDEGGDGASDDKPATTASAAPAPAASAPATPAGPQPRGAAPVPDAPEPPKPDSVVVAAYKKRRRIPAWAMLGLALLPMWMFLYVKSVTTQPVEAAGPLAVGEETYGSCQSCHGGSGDGGSGYAFSSGEVLKTFPHIEDQIRYVMYGTEDYNAAGVEIYGNPDREGGAHITGARSVMPAQAGTLTDAEILAVVCYERFTLGGADGDAAFETEFEEWCSEESAIFEAVETGAATLANVHEAVELDPPMIPIGDTPVPGSPAG